MDNKLLPCPFCGEKATLNSIWKLNEKLVNYTVFCSNQDCVASIDGVWSKNKNPIIKQWNTRIKSS